MANREGTLKETEEAQDLLGASVAGRYKVLSLIARGGMGRVYKAEQSALGRVCALKVLSPHYDGKSDPEFHKRFSLEASTAAKLQHPNTVTIFDYGKCDEHGVYYIAMEYLDGRTLHRVLHDERALPENRVAHIAQQVCRSVHEAHRLGVVHRDLKPSNILLVERGDEPDFVKVLDFGLVKDVTGYGEDLTQTGLFMGSPKYMAPEQVLGEEVSPRTDVYALGVVLYEMLTGKVPFDRKAGMSTLVAHVNDAPPALRERKPDLVVSAEMEEIVMRCLAKEPDQRFSSMKDLLVHLKRASGDLTDTYESMPRARVDYDAALAMGRRSEPPGFTGARTSTSPPPRPSVPPPSVSGTLRSPAAYNIVAPQTDVSGPYGGSGGSDSGAQPASLSGGATDSVSRLPAERRGDSLSPPQAPTVSGPLVRPGPPAWRTFAVAAIALIVGGATAAAVLSRRNEAPPGVAAAPTVTAAPPAVAIAVSPTSEAPRGPGVRVLRIESEPPGAVVSDQGVQVCMHTPCDVYWQGQVARLEHRLTLDKRGFRQAVLVVSPTDESPTASVKLEAWALGEIAAAAGNPQGGNPYGANVEPLPGPTAARPSADPAPAVTGAPAAPPPAAVPPTVTAAAPVATAPAEAAAPAATVAAAPSPAQPAAVPPPTSGPMHLEDVDTRPKRLSCADPTWSREALEAKVSGTVVAKCTVTAAGSLSGCRIVKGLPFMDGPVLASLATCRYAPAMARGAAVAVDMPITMRLAAP